MQILETTDEVTAPLISLLAPPTMYNLDGGIWNISGEIVEIGRFRDRDR